MKKVILDTSFILTCVKQKIDFFKELKFMGLKVLIPEQVVGELGGIATSSSNAELALQILKKNKFEQVDLKTKDVDKGVIKFAEKNTDFFIATLDRELKKKTMNSKIVIREKKRLEVV